MLSSKKTYLRENMKSFLKRLENYIFVLEIIKFENPLNIINNNIIYNLRQSTGYF